MVPAPPASRDTHSPRHPRPAIGLPPSPEEIEAFVNDPAPDAYERLIDRLLASPHYGELQGRHWLAVARFAESNGYEFDEDRSRRLAIPRLRRPRLFNERSTL